MKFLRPRKKNLLSSWEFELGTTESFDGDVGLIILASDGDQDLSDVTSGSLTVGLTKGTSHTGLEPIRSSTTQHLVHTQHVERMRADTDVKIVFTAVGHQVLVDGDTGSLQTLGTQLLLLIGHHVHSAGKDVSGVLLATRIVDSELRVRDTSAKTRFRVRLVLAVAVTLVRTTTHLDNAGSSYSSSR